MESTLAFNVRPLLTAYLIDEDDHERFIDVALLSCTQWGGIHNYIIPVSETRVGTAFCVPLAVHEPDRVVVATRRHHSAAIAFCDRELRHVERELSWEHHVRRDNVVHAVALHAQPPGYSRSDPVVPGSRPVLLEYQDAPDSTPFQSACAIAAFGGILPDQRSYYETHFHIGPANWSAVGDPFLSLQLSLEVLASPVNLTKARITNRMQFFSGLVYFDVVLAATVADLCWYWTTRAVRDLADPVTTRRTLVVPESMFIQAETRRNLIEMLRPQLADPYRQSAIDIVFHKSAEGGRGAIQAIRRGVRAGLLRPRAFSEGIGTSFRSSAGEPQPNERHTSDAPLVYDMNIGASPAGRMLTFGIDNPSPRLTELKEGKTSVQAPIRHTLSDMDGRIALDISGDVWARYPRCHAIATRTHPGSRFTRYGLTVPMHRALYDRPLELDLPTSIESVRAYLRERGYHGTLNPVGLLAHAVVDLFGGIEECGVLRDRAVYAVLDALALKSPAKISRMLANLMQGRIGNLGTELRDELAEALPAIVRDLVVLPNVGTAPTTIDLLRQRDDLRPHSARILDIMAELVQRRLVFRGCNVVCIACGVSTWFALGAVQDHIVCPGCFKAQALSVQTGGKERGFEYRLNTLVNTAIDGAALAPILLLAQLASDPALDVESPLMGIELKPIARSDAVGDFDIVYVRDQRLYAGECKAGRGLKPKDIDLGRLARALGCAGFHFASLAGFNSEARSMIEVLRREAERDDGFEVLIHGPDDLFIRA